MTATLHSLMPDASTREFVNRYSLAPHHLVDDRLRASHISRQRGDGLEFHQYRPYQSGDDLRLVDWRLYARSDRMYVREAQQESRLTVCLLIDTTASMLIQDSNGRPRIEMAKRIAAALGWLAVHRQHPCMAVAFGPAPSAVLQRGTGLRQMERLCHWLDSLAPDEGWPTRATQHQLMQAIPPRSLVIALSDFAAIHDSQRGSWRDLMSQAHALISVQLLVAAETRFDARGSLQIVEPESGVKRLVDSKRVAQQFPGRLRRWLDAVRREQVGLGARYVRAQTEQPTNDILAAALSEKRSADARLLVAP
ncbi:MAG: DUF58 domain-containing protein [Pseudomonadota bacterium]